MYYQKALKIAGIAHKSQKRDCGQMYIFHPWRIAKNFLGSKSDLKTIAILHDVVEDTPIRLKDLRRLGFSKKVVDGVDAMSRRKDEEFKDYIRRLAKNNDAIHVKFADIADNMKDCKPSLLPRYEWALKYLDLFD